MVNKFFLIVKRIILSALFIYAYDSFMFFSNHVIPINFINLVFVSIFDVVGMICLILFSFL